MHHLVILKFCHSRTSIEMLATQADKYRLTIFKIIQLLMFEMGSEVGCLFGIWRSHDCQKTWKPKPRINLFSENRLFCPRVQEYRVKISSVCKVIGSVVAQKVEIGFDASLCRNSFIQSLAVVYLLILKRPVQTVNVLNILKHVLG